MEDEIVVKRCTYLKVLMLIFTVALVVAAVFVFIYSIRTSMVYYDEKIGNIEVVQFGEYYRHFSKITTITIPGAVFFFSLILLAIASFIYYISLSAWRIRITKDSIFVKTLTTSEVEYKKSDIVISNLRPEQTLPNNNNPQALGSHYVVWLKLTKQQITDVYDKDKNSEFIKELCSNN